MVLTRQLVQLRQTDERRRRPKFNCCPVQMPTIFVVSITAIVVAYSTAGSSIPGDHLETSRDHL
jgi:hypothetical protein